MPNLETNIKESQIYVLDCSALNSEEGRKIIGILRCGLSRSLEIEDGVILGEIERMKSLEHFQNEFPLVIISQTRSEIRSHLARLTKYIGSIKESPFIQSAGRKKLLEVERKIFLLEEYFKNLKDYKKTIYKRDPRERGCIFNLPFIGQHSQDYMELFEKYQEYIIKIDNNREFKFNGYRDADSHIMATANMLDRRGYNVGIISRDEHINRMVRISKSALSNCSISFISGHFLYNYARNDLLAKTKIPNSFLASHVSQLSA